MSRAYILVQNGVHILKRIFRQYSLLISTVKTEFMAFKWVDPLRAKIVIGNVILEQANSVKHLCVQCFLY